MSMGMVMCVGVGHEHGPSEQHWSGRGHKMVASIISDVVWLGMIS